MAKVPDRFLGYAYCVGDVLLELDADFTILHADGAVNNKLGGADIEVGISSFLSLLNDKGRALIESAASMLTGANRLGPFTISVGKVGAPRNQFSIFMAKLPTAENRYYVVLSRPYRLGAREQSGDTRPSAREEKKQEFFARLESLFDGNPEAEETMQVTVLEPQNAEILSADQKGTLEKFVQSFSVGGSLSAMVGDEKYAFVHEKVSRNGRLINYVEEIKKATGLTMSSATIDASEARLSEKDSVRAMIFSLQQFAEGHEGFTVEQMQENCSTLIGETADRVVAFRKLLDEGAFSLVYQPIVELKTGKTHHYEALARFELPPMVTSNWTMIRFAEDVGLISDFDMAVLVRSINKLRSILKNGETPGLAVNVSGRSLSDPEFLLELASLLKGNKDLKKYLSIEITESSRIHDLDGLAEVLRNVRAEGFKVYLDDFGAGAAGFQYLKKLKVDALKIDGDYVKNALTSKEDRAFLHSMVTLCKDLGIQTVGEWVETKELADLLTSLGVDYGQGYYFGKPNSGIASAQVG